MAATAGTENSKTRPVSRNVMLVLTWVSAATIVVMSVTTPWDYALFHADLGYWATLLLGLCTLAVLAWDRSLGKGLGSLSGVLILALASVYVEAVTAAKMGTGAIGFIFFAVFPALWFASSLIGYAARRNAAVPLAVSNAAVWLSVVGGVLGFAQWRGIHFWPVDAYAQVSAAAGAWRPTVGEVFRAAGFLIDPNYYGLVGALGIALAVGLEGRVRSRCVLAVGSCLVIAMSGSRTAITVVPLAAVAWLAVSLLKRDDLRRRWLEVRPVVVAFAAPLIALALALAVFEGPQGMIQRITHVQAAGSFQTQESEDVSVLESVTGRTAIWGRAWDIYKNNPLGSYITPEVIMKGSIHNEFLTRLVHAGPLYVVVLLYFLGWLAFRVRPPDAPALGPILAVTYVSAAMTLTPSMLTPIIGMFYFFVGWGAAGTRRETVAPVAKPAPSSKPGGQPSARKQQPGRQKPYRKKAGRKSA